LVENWFNAILAVGEQKRNNFYKTIKAEIADDWTTLGFFMAKDLNMNVGFLALNWAIMYTLYTKAEK